MEELAKTINLILYFYGLGEIDSQAINPTSAPNSRIYSIFITKKDK